MELILMRAVYRRCCWAQLAFFCLSVIMDIPYRISLKSVREWGLTVFLDAVICASR